MINVESTIKANFYSKYHGITVSTSDLICQITHDAQPAYYYTHNVHRTYNAYKLPLRCPFRRITLFAYSCAGYVSIL